MEEDLKLGFTLKELTFSGLNEQDEASRNSTTLELHDDKLVCVEYPAIISSVDKMLETLGGEQTLSQTYSNPNLRLELRYRPQDPFCHFLCGNRFSSNNLLLRVRRRIRKRDAKVAELNTEILGVIGTTYKFQGMADYQCLAVHCQDGKQTSLYNKIILQKPEKQEFFKQPTPYFLPPAIFSRLDTPVDYFYRPDVAQKLQADVQSKTNFIGMSRPRRPHNAIFVSYTDPSVPTEALEAAKTHWARIGVRAHDKQAEERLVAMFESRPIWSRNALKANINIHPDKLKMLLPVLAYYMVTGPWRSLWVKLGYDPRKTVDSKKYQLLDYRMRCSTKSAYFINNLVVKPKRSTLKYTLPITVNKTAPIPASVTDLPTQDGSSTSRDPVQTSYQLKDSSYIFREGMLPPHRQMFYQLCDLHVPGIQEIIEQNSGAEEVCNERDGWCPVGTTDKLRNVISTMIKKVIKAQKLPMQQRRTARRSNGDAEDEEDEEDNDYEDDNEEDEYQPSDGSENEMETEILDYM
ncbi:general transcription factor 3C polypeptide 5 [Corythoichthys intestinalis]|uniref:general transcription factor 3C polypeptide 5 n=1 Tax=Corythoichthys intestinalis TaxID=161448 RepID=UPI0025A515C6|nr:general transcription factor 3C polypeptide 5 [Corythoichthys intestinalis]XP_061800697.1 general transcription factor 3C polypeptide 5-like [Nerophis lumbriciformis]